MRLIAICRYTGVFRRGSIAISTANCPRVLGRAGRGVRRISHPRNALEIPRRLVCDGRAAQKRRRNGLAPRRGVVSRGN